MTIAANADHLATAAAQGRYEVTGRTRTGAYSVCVRASSPAAAIRIARPMIRAMRPLSPVREWGIRLDW